MKKFRKTIAQYILHTEQKWKALPEKRQRLFTKVFLAGYTLLTLCVFVQIWVNGANGKNIPIGGHISNIPTGIQPMNQSLKTTPINNIQK
ncbi:hypothetical protein K0U91_01000 [Chryseobacterium chendengshani]|uniref:hypothetical protein n=1 Tax=Chryseobacterium sp. LJ668 TaxID=2864040 RepID=UPI001C690A4D|nr:hypothetical protein [Chryseobacterium sp. LJ668]MBW8523801.1 hypothetical protein [Chryseobacterium sp. LJ668]QYK16744.1 hypothetical protein K0U91_01000 [Chryseobacterium sp. LJ668]